MKIIPWAENIFADSVRQYGELYKVYDETSAEIQEKIDFYGVKPCPFCGSDSDYISVRAEEKRGQLLFYVGCVNCGGRTEGFTSKIYHGEYPRRFWMYAPGEAAGNALKAWNKRKKPQ